MGDFRITVEGVGSHGCGREAKAGEEIKRCGQPHCVDCKAALFVADLKASGANVVSAHLEHWPIPGAAGTTRTENPGPIDNLLTGTRSASF